MFRTGGSAGGITSGLRRGYAEAGPVDPTQLFDQTPDYLPGLATAKEEVVEETPGGNEVMDKVEAAYRTFGAPTELPKSTAGSDFLMNLGLNLMSGPSTGSFFGNVGEAAKEPLGQFQKARAAEKAMKYKRGESERGLKFEIWKSLSKDEQDQYYNRAKMLVREGRAKTVGEALNILFPGTRKPAHEEDILRDERIRLEGKRDEAIGYWKKEEDGLTDTQGGNIVDFDRSLSDWISQGFEPDGNQLWIDPDDKDKFKQQGKEWTLKEGEDLNFNHDYSPNKIYVDSFTGKVYQFDGGTFTEVELTEEDIKS
jgi:hypothetical protein